MNENENLVPKRRFKEFTNTGTWEQRKLGDMVEFFSGLTYSPDNVIKQPGTLVLRSSNVQNGEIVNADNVYVDNEVVNSDNVQVGDIAVVVRNGSRSLIGKHAAIKYPMKDTVIGAFMTGVRSDTPSFTNALLDTQQFETEIAKNLGATINQITTGNFKKMIFNFPEIDERLRIGDFFNQLDNTIALHQRQLDNHKELKKAMLQKMFPQEGETVPEVRFEGFTEEWEQRKFSNIVNRVSQQSNDSNLPKVEFEDIISGEGRLNKDISSKFDSRKGTVFEPEFILYGKLRPYLKNWLFPNFKGIALGDFWVFEPNNSSSIFDYYLIQSDKYQTVANLSSGTKMPRSDWKTVSETEFSIPVNIEEQTKIGTFFKQLDDTVALHQQKIINYQTVKSALFKKMFV